MRKLLLIATAAAAMAVLPSTTAFAAHFGARAGAGFARGPIVAPRIGPRVGVYYRPYGFGFAYDPFWVPGWGYAYPYVVPQDNTGGLRLEVTPKTAQVFVDGYYAGVVDDFNGHFQHLDMTPGGHHIDVRQPGFQPMTFDVYVQPGHTSDYKGALVPDGHR